MPSPPPLQDPIRLEVYRHLFTALAEEMGATLRRSAYSPNIKERRDYSCALFDAAGEAVAMGDHMPVHLGAMPMSVRAALDELGPLAPGDVAALNDPFRGGTHLPDITLVAPVHLDGDAEPVAYVASRAHHADVGGMAAGSMPLAREIYQEGLRIPPVRLVAGGQRVEDVWRLVLANVRTPAERAGDLDAQLAALVAGERRLRELVARRGGAEVRSAMAGLLAYADRLLRAGIARIPDGVYEAEDAMEDDGVDDGPLPIRLRLTVAGDEVEADFSGTAPQARGGINAVEAITASATRYALRVVVERLLGQPLPAGGGAMAALRLTVPPGTILSARPPASVAGGNVETSQRITDVLLLALAEAVPEVAAAQSQGTMNNLTVGGVDPRTGEPFAYYETMAGGMGGGADGPGLSGVHVHMTNSLNTPVEALEHAYPFRVRRYALRRGTGGGGRHPGGDGVRRDVELLVDGDVSLLTERRRRAPRGLAGGGDGALGRNLLIRDGAERELPSKTTLSARAGDVLSLRSPGGGGWGE
ncbi:MAG: hydantoinase B/oxoprolinase family protein [Gemmatimonadetes bacterium]|nr:hydantoinase B/oxoprolinase family protein [Gemmatimonadota bacterium]NIQ55121.1 hydantoinase B/oxoprolinase family protein [Gemmatimonadota bacterium]NIU75317.1 hydantoinase B/oxoprolinase family protein [Gammaproteobacteria bacterium]NIX45100.1 hydantoinase B/oxoprolinase family protein [Gemmatimonadota bacterium]NIY09353.1 hydantoinase B/oxoprolinase family protein [Gemmatimonadota bacterium]